MLKKARPLEWVTFTLFLMLLSGCTSPSEKEADHDHGHEASSAEGTLTLPEIEAMSLTEGRLNVVATTNIIGNVVAQVGQDTIDLTVLLGANQDPHSYEATPSDLVALEQADLIFMNGWDLEEQLAETIEENFADKMVQISAGVTPLNFGDDDEHGDEDHDDEDHADEDDHDDHGHSGTDPHVWFSIHNVEIWVTNISTVLQAADPQNAESYASNANVYLEELEELETKVDQLMAQLPADRRKIITNHDSLGYFAADYDFEIVGTVIPAASTSAEPSASDLANLIEAMEKAGACTIFGETTQNDRLAQTVADELSGCDSVEVIALYSGSLGDGAASSYTGMFLQNVENIVDGLGE